MKHKLVFDTECSPDYFMVGFKRIDTKAVRQYEMFAGQPFPRQAVLGILQNYTVIGFNSMDYDMPMLFYALKLSEEIERGELTIPEALRMLKALSDFIVTTGSRGWQTAKEFGFVIPEWVDHIDLKEPVPGVQISLKLYGARLHSKRLQDLPYDHNEPVFGWPEDRRTVILKYNDNDLDTTIDLWGEATKPSDNIIETRERLSVEFGVDMRSRSDAQIAEAAIKSKVSKLTGMPVYRSEVRPGTSYDYVPPAFIKFATPALQAVLATVLSASFVVAATGSIEMPPELANAEVRIGQGVYRMGIGGLHSSEKRQVVVANEHILLRDLDVTSYYPSLILLCGLFPPNMGHNFQIVYSDFFKRRVMAKRKGEASTSQTLKIVLNGTFGKLGSKWSVLYAPNLLIQVTLTGQLALLMLIERMEMAGIRAISANTDGVVFAVPRHLEQRQKEIVAQWEKDTGLEMEATDYKALYSRDVNSYLAVKMNGKAKVKGALAASDAQHNPSNEIVKKAVIEFLCNGTPIAETIYGCRDIRQFLTAQRVTGGAQMPTSKRWLDEWVEVEDRVWQMQYGARTFKEKRKSRPSPVLVTESAQYLGKVVRWYRSTKSTTHIENVKTGGKVPSSDNAMPLMTLPDEFPGDVDYAAYINEAVSTLRDLGALQ